MGVIFCCLALVASFLLGGERREQLDQMVNLHMMDEAALRTWLQQQDGGRVSIERCELSSSSGNSQQRSCLLDGALAARINHALETARQSEQLSTTLSLLTKVHEYSYSFHCSQAFSHSTGCDIRESLLAKKAHSNQVFAVPVLPAFIGRCDKCCICLQRSGSGSTCSFFGTSRTSLLEVPVENTIHHTASCHPDSFPSFPSKDLE